MGKCGAVFQHFRVSGKSFERSSIVLDKVWFESCSFHDCEVFYSRGQTSRPKRKAGAPSL